MKTLTVSQVRMLDKKAQEVYGVSALILMENAGRAVADEAAALKKKEIAVFCGKGNNGGDGLVCSRHLLAMGMKPDIFLAGEMSELKAEAKLNLGILLKLKHKIFEVNRRNIGSLKKKLARYDLIIDAVFGVGLKGAVEGFAAEIIELINHSGAYILSVDVPSGLDADTADAPGACIRANKTVTFVAVKHGMAGPKGPEYCGKVVVKGLGLPL